ncbi:hypothetical protein [Burkholderia cenocepacia]|uniref:hypothetical protein n=1 Tax=Burkholderia cenocepacia TaxID=95486 RepID=UPI00158976A9|nr:hypothetical protein [Burkholderia cenocepacia]
MIESRAAAGFPQVAACVEAGVSTRHIEYVRHFAVWYLSDQLAVSRFARPANPGGDDSDKTVWMKKINDPD